MSEVLQWALGLASVAIMVLAVCLIPLAIQIGRRMEGLARSGAEIKDSLDLLLRDSRDLVQNVNALSRRAQVQMDEMDVVMKTVRGWTVRADRLVEGIGSVIEPPIFSLAALSNLARAGAGAFVQSLVQGCLAGFAGRKQAQHEESEHV